MVGNRALSALSTQTLLCTMTIHYLERKMAVDLVFKVPSDLPAVREKLSQGWSFEDIVNSHLGGPFSILFEDLLNLHSFRFDEVELLKDLQILDSDYLRALYKMEIVSALRIRRFVKEMKTPYIFSKIEKLCKEGFYLFGVVFGSTGRFEATKRSDFEYTFFFFPSDRSRLGRKEVAFLRKSLDKDVRSHIEREFPKWNEFRSCQSSSTVSVSP